MLDWISCPDTIIFTLLCGILPELFEPYIAFANPPPPGGGGVTSIGGRTRCSRKRGKRVSTGPSEGGGGCGGVFFCLRDCYRGRWCTKIPLSRAWKIDPIFLEGKKGGIPLPGKFLHLEPEKTVSDAYILGDIGQRLLEFDFLQFPNIKGARR